MLNFISPWMTQYTREKHNGEKEPSRNMSNRKYGRSGGGGKWPTPYTGARKARTIASLERRVVEHPNDAKARARLASMQAAS